MNAINAASGFGQVSEVADPGNLSATLVASLHAELAAIYGVIPGHSLTGDYAALKDDAAKLAQTAMGVLEADLDAATHFLVGCIRVGHRRRYDDWEVWGDPALGGYEVLPKPEHHPNRGTALARARELAGE